MPGHCLQSTFDELTFEMSDSVQSVFNQAEEKTMKILCKF